MAYSPILIHAFDIGCTARRARAAPQLGRRAGALLLSAGTWGMHAAPQRQPFRRKSSEATVRLCACGLLVSCRLDGE